ncbi:MAG: hypothetical protein NUV77_13165 [Thermoguttaceae bacterium]|jgi:hypothetical protein|nr:hypothetical protein [Thermoguttaceae bacterium]
MKQPSLVLTIQISLVAALVLCVALAGIAWWRNSKEIARCQDLVRRAINEELRGFGVDPIQSVYFPDASRLLGVPTVLGFDSYLFHTDKNVGRRGVGEMSGTFDRTTNHLDVTFDFTDGVRRDKRIQRTLGEGPDRSSRASKP